MFSGKWRSVPPLPSGDPDGVVYTIDFKNIDVMVSGAAVGPDR